MVFILAPICLAKISHTWPPLRCYSLLNYVFSTTLQLAVRVCLISLKVPKPEIRIRIHTSDKWIRIWILDAQKHVDPVDPDPDSDRDPQHC